jgi:hypothetical protein
MGAEESLVFARIPLTEKPPVHVSCRLVASPVPAPKISICAEKQRLTDDLLSSAGNLSKLHDQEMGDLAHGGSADRFDLAICLARRRRKQAMRVLRVHIREHGC